MTLTLPYPPSVNAMYATVGRRRVLSREGRTFKETAAALAYRAGVRKLAGDVKVTINLFRPRRAGDCDNFSKAVLDSLKGVAWIDDAQVKRITAERFEDPSNPRAEVTIEEWSYEEIKP